MSIEIGSFSPKTPVSVELQNMVVVSSLASSGDGPISWYNEESQMTDDELLEAYFHKNPKLAEQVARMKAHKRKRQTDASLARDYKFSLEVHRRLMKRKWEVC